MKKEHSAYRAALYLRLSREDGGAQSASICTQRRMLRRYATEMGYAIYDEYVDDGWSGTNFDRPAFSRMIADIEAKKVNMVITKDLSRLGRDYITAGQYTEIYFPAKGVRYIAINDGYDSDDPCTDIVPFKNILNEMYARDTSKKIRSAFLTKMQEGAFIAAFAPYGYQKDPADKHRLIVDSISGPVVKSIFRLAAEGLSPTGIARKLNGQGIVTPAVYRQLSRPGYTQTTDSAQPQWSSATITKMLKNPVYCGHTVQGKTGKVSFKSNLTVSKPRNEWITVKHTHEALVEEATFQMVQRQMQTRTCHKKGQFSNLFSGIAKCADCGRNMSATGSRKKGSPANLVCSGYKLSGSGTCSNHFIDYNALYAIVAAALKEQLAIDEKTRQAILEQVQKRHPDTEQNRTNELSSCQRRIGELERIIEKLYGDNACGRLSDERMEKLLCKYEQQARILEYHLAELKQTDGESEKIQKNTTTDLSRSLQQLIDVSTLTRELLFRFIQRIEIGQGFYEKGTNGRCKHQSVKIFYRFQTQPQIKEYRISFSGFAANQDDLC